MTTESIEPVEASRHHGDARRRLAAESERFFERVRVSRSFDERGTAPTGVKTKGG